MLASDNGEAELFKMSGTWGWLVVMIAAAVEAVRDNLGACKDLDPNPALYQPKY